MTDENIMTNKNDTTAAVPPAPNGQGAGNGAESESAAPSAAAAKDAQPSSKKKKKKRHAHAEKPASGQVEPAAAAGTDQPAPTIATAEPAASAEPTGPTEPTASTEQTPSSVEHAAAPSEEPAAAPVEESLRIRVKIWTDPTTSKRYLVPSAFMRDLDANGRPISDVMYAYALRDDDTKRVTLTAAEWNALPFFYFQEDGPAPRVTMRPVDGGRPS